MVGAAVVAEQGDLALEVECDLERLLAQPLVGLDVSRQGQLGEASELLEEGIFMVLFPNQRVIVLQTLLVKIRLFMVFYL